MTTGGVVDGEVVDTGQRPGEEPEWLLASDRYRWETTIRGYFPTGRQCIPATALMLATYGNHKKGTHKFPGQELLAADIGANAKAVREALRWLVGAGWLHKVRAGNRKAGHSDEYRLTIPGAVAKDLGLTGDEWIEKRA